MADEDLLPIDENEDWKKSLAALAPRPQMDSRMMQAAPVAPMNPTGTPDAAALKIPGNEGLASPKSDPMTAPSLTGGLKVPDFTAEQPAYTPPVASSMLRTIGQQAQPMPQTPPDLEPHGWRKALGLSLLALTGKNAGANADEFLHGGERRYAAQQEQQGQQKLRDAQIANLQSEAATRQPKGPTNELELFLRNNPNGTLDQYETAKGGKPAKDEDITKAYGQALIDGDMARAAELEPRVTQFLKTTQKPPAPEKETDEDKAVSDYMAGKGMQDTPVNRTSARAAVAAMKREPVSQTGTWTLAEDSQGNTVEMNSKTGQTRPAPNVQKAGTADKRKGELEKQTGPVDAAVQYASDYLTNGTFTGPGDEALQEKFFELAKPSTGFRMSQPQMDMLRNSQSWMNSIEAKARHAISGTWFSDEQRKQIVYTMQDLARSKKNAITNVVTGGRGGGKPAGAVNIGTSKKDGKDHYLDKDNKDLGVVTP